MKRDAEPPVSFTRYFLAILFLTATAVAVAQPRPPAPPGAPEDMLDFEVLSIDPQSWVVTARDLESGDEFRFRLPPEAFRGQRFHADLSGAEAGARISVTGEPQARLRQVRVESPLARGARRSDVAFGRGPGEEGRGPDRFAVPEGPGEYGVQAPERDASRFGNRPGPLAERGAGPGGAGLYEVVEVDPATWTVTARGADGGTMSLVIDPEAFAGYRFRASVEGLRAGEGFELLAGNERPLTDCCTVRERSRR